MKNILLTFVIVFAALFLIAQSPQAFKYQAVARDNTANVLVNQNVSFQISILQGSVGGASVYAETHDATTNNFGLVNLEIGNGAVVSGVFDDIDWGGNIYFLQVEMDETGGVNYQLMGTTQLMSVPYALYAESSGDAGAAKIDDLTDAITIGNNLYLGRETGINDDSTNNQNVGIGRETLMMNTSGHWNIAIGYFALSSNTVGQQNTATGYNSLLSNSTGIRNTAYGHATNLFNLEGSNNTMIGYQAGRGSTLHNKTGNVFLGYQAGYNDTTDNKLYIENSNSSSPLIWGDFANDILTVNGSLGVGTTNPSAKLEVNGNAKADTLFADAFSSNSPLLLQTNGTTRIYVDDTTGNVGIGTEILNESTLLELNSNSMGFLPPRMTEVQRDSISNPIAGLQIFNTTTSRPNFYSGTVWMYFDNTNAEPLAIGDFYQGGVIFYLDGSGGGLVCAIDHGVDVEWGCVGIAISGADGTAIGTGGQNTIDIVYGCTTPEIAAEECTISSLNGYTDWFLPSKDELYEMYLNKATIDSTAITLGGWPIFPTDYWSSSESTTEMSWVQHFGNGLQDVTIRI